MGLKGERTVPLDGNHLSMVKYSSKENTNYGRVSKNLAAMISRANKARAGSET